MLLRLISSPSPRLKLEQIPTDKESLKYLEWRRIYSLRLEEGNVL